MPDVGDALKEDLLPRTSDWPNGACNGKKVTPKLTSILLLNIAGVRQSQTPSARTY